MDINGLPRYLIAITEHSICQPGLPLPRDCPRQVPGFLCLPQREIHWVFLPSSTSTRAPASSSSNLCPDSFRSLLKPTYRNKHPLVPHTPFLLNKLLDKGNHIINMLGSPGWKIALLYQGHRVLKYSSINRSPNSLQLCFPHLHGLSSYHQYP